MLVAKDLAEPVVDPEPLAQRTNVRHADGGPIEDGPELLLAPFFITWSCATALVASTAASSPTFPETTMNGSRPFSFSSASSAPNPGME